jgi:hypothetical protein
MWMTRTVAAAVLVVMTGLPALAQPIEIATLGRAPLMGESTSAGELQSNFRKNEALMRRAGMGLGLTPEQYEQFRLALDVGKPNWVTVPRHLDAMTWAAGGEVHVLRDVIIPPNLKGLEVDLHSGDNIIALFLPAKCGNLSVIRRSLPHIAAVRNFPVPHVAAVTAPAPPQRQTVAVAPPVEVPPLVAAVPPPPVPIAAVHHGFGLWPLAAVLPFLVRGSSTPGSPPFVSGTIVGPPAPACP